MNSVRLYAKSLPKDWKGDSEPESVYLLGHLQDVHRSVLQLLEHTASAQLQALNLPLDKWEARFRRIASLAAALHDLGKANHQFQEMIRVANWTWFGVGDVTGLPDNPRQSLRHEWGTLLIIDEPDWKSWLLPALEHSETDWEILRWAIAGHHPKYGRSAPPELQLGPAGMKLPLDHPDIRGILHWLKAEFGLEGEPDCTPRTCSLTFEEGNALDRIHAHFYQESFLLFEDFDEPMRRFVGAVKNCLVAADIAGSALPREVSQGVQQDAWISETLGEKTLPTAEVYQRIAAHRRGCKPVELDNKLYPFQTAVARQSSRVVFVKAGCGSGKTLAAYRWAQQHCAGRRLFVCYPTTGTATEGFRDYLLDPNLAEFVKTDLLHSRRKIDLKMLEVDENHNEALARIESLDTWRLPVVACTVDSVLGIVQNNRRGLYSWPALAQSGFVFDEIHSYDDKLFDALLHFLTAFQGVPILLMTASLQASRKQAIADCLARQGETLAEVGGSEELETLQRYVQRTFADRGQAIKGNAALAAIRAALAKEEKVLVVCNTVARCMELARELAEFEPLVYHSRFKYCDRVEQHRQVVAAFQKEELGKVLAICTQVAEMSLDISATMLVTELAPVPALIQRLGRLNRRAEPGSPVRDFLIVEPQGTDGKFSAAPYDADELDTARKWLEKLGGGPLNQRDLAEQWEQFDTVTAPPRWQSAWLDYGPANPVLELREGSPNITVIMEEDLPALKKRSVMLAEVALPMPLQRGAEWQRTNSAGKPDEFNGVPVARTGSIDYSPTRGARWL